MARKENLCVLSVAVVILLAAGGANGQPPPGAGPVTLVALPLQIVAADAKGVLRPVANVEVSVRVAGKPAAVSHRTDQQGRCSLDLLPANVQCDVSVQSALHEPTTRQVTFDSTAQTFQIVRREGNRSITLILGPNVWYRIGLKAKAGGPPPPPPPPGAKGSINVYVVERGAGKLVPVARADVSFIQGARQVASGVTDGGGVYGEKLPVGQTYNVFVTKPGYATGKIIVKIEQGHMNRTVELKKVGGGPPPALASLRVYTRMWDAAAGALRPLGGVAVTLTTNNQPVTSGTTDASGRLTLSAAPGTYRMDLRKVGYRHVWQPQYTLPAAGRQYETTMTPDAAQPPPPASLRVYMRARDAAGVLRPLGGVAVTLEVNNRPVTSGTTDATGRVTLSAAPGQYRLDFRKGGYVHKWLAQYTLPAAGAQYETTMTPDAGPPPPPPTLPVLRVRVSRMPDYAGIAGAEVIAMRNGVEIKRVRSGADGMCSIPLAAGTYQLIVSATGFRTGTASATVSPGGGSAGVTLQRN